MTDKTELAELEAALEAANRRADAAQDAVNDAEALLREAEDEESAARLAIERFFAKSIPESVADAIAMMRGSWGAVFDGKTAITNGHAMTIVDGAHEVGFFRQLTAEAVAKTSSVERQPLGFTTAAALAEACAYVDEDPRGSDQPKVSVGPATVNPMLLRAYVSSFASLAPDERVEVLTHGVLGGVEFRGSTWRAYVMPLRSERGKRTLSVTP